MESLEAILFAFALDERNEDEDFLICRVLEDASQEKLYEYEEEGLQIKIIIEKQLLQIDYASKEAFIHIRTNALSTVNSQSYFFAALYHVDEPPEDFGLDLSYGKLA